MQVVPNTNTAYYISNFITEEEEKQLMDNIDNHRWINLSNRRLQNHGGNPNEKGMLVQDLPSFLKRFNEAKLHKLFDELLAKHPNQEEVSKLKQKTPNHVLVNEYFPNQGIMYHKDGPIYLDCVFIVSLLSSVVLRFKKDLNQKEDDFCLVLEPRSLIVFTDDLYHVYHHAISENEVEIINTKELPIANLQLLQKELQDSLQDSILNLKRDRRVSLTVRIVKKVLLQNNKFIRI